MLKNATYKERFQLVEPWMNRIIEAVKKDLRQEHLMKDWQFVKKHFPGKNPQKLTVEELAPVYASLLTEGSEELGEFITNRWLLKNSEVYYFFEEELRKLHPDFSELDELDKQISKKLLDVAVEQFGPIRTYLFSVLNSVVFPKEIYQGLRELALKSKEQAAEQAMMQFEKETLEGVKKNYEREIARLTDKYEKKLIGLQKKYAIDTEALKKQLQTLQRKSAVKVES